MPVPRRARAGTGTSRRAILARVTNVRSVLYASALAALTLLATGCGAKPKPRAAPSPGARAAAAIRSRLTKAGYTVQDDTFGAVVGAAPAKPRGMVASFHVEVDFTSPRSFKLEVDVFDSHRDVERWLASERDDVKRFLVRCRRSASCRLSLERDGTPKLPAERVVGPAVYSAATDIEGKKLPVARFEALVNLAAGRTSG